MHAMVLSWGTVSTCDQGQVNLRAAEVGKGVAWKEMPLVKGIERCGPSQNCAWPRPERPSPQRHWLIKAFNPLSADLADEAAFAETPHAHITSSTVQK